VRRAGYVAGMGEDMMVHKVWVGKPEGKRPLGKPRHRWDQADCLEECRLDPVGLG
jgi:hypothetical protein